MSLSSSFYQFYHIFHLSLDKYKCSDESFQGTMERLSAKDNSKDSGNVYLVQAGVMGGRSLGETYLDWYRLALIPFIIWTC